MSAVPGYRHDVFVNFAREDNIPAADTEKGFVTQFVLDLKVEITRKFGDDVDIWWDYYYNEGDARARLAKEILVTASECACAVVVVSSAYLSSNWCEWHRNAFYKRHPQRPAGAIFVVALEPIDQQTLPTMLRDLVGYPFYRTLEDGHTTRQLRGDFASDKELYYNRLSDLANDVATYINQLRHGTSDRSQESVTKPAVTTDARDRAPAVRRIFLCYRRDDSGAIVGRIYDRLSRDFGEQNIFKDVDNIPFGVDFVEHLDGEIQKCDVVFVVIGPRWLACDSNSAQRLEDPRDFVRIEIVSALRRAIPVVPLLVDGAEMPRVNQLPDEIKPLAYRNGAQIRHDPDFHNDLSRLLSRLG